MMPETAIFAGTGSNRASVMMWTDPQSAAEPQTVSRFPRGYSIYGLAISPNATRIAVPNLLRCILPPHLLRVPCTRADAAPLRQVIMAQAPDRTDVRQTTVGSARLGGSAPSSGGNSIASFLSS